MNTTHQISRSVRLMWTTLAVVAIATVAALAFTNSQAKAAELPALPIALPALPIPLPALPTPALPSLPAVPSIPVPAIPSNSSELGGDVQDVVCQLDSTLIQPLGLVDQDLINLREVFGCDTASTTTATSVSSASVKAASTATANRCLKLKKKYAKHFRKRASKLRARKRYVRCVKVQKKLAAAAKKAA
jgi:hypothetical protein